MTEDILLIPKTPGRFRRMQNILDQADIVTYINRIENKRFELIVNGEVKKQYRNRNSANKYITKMYKKLKPAIPPAVTPPLRGGREGLI